jgi:metal-dependent amidase/aminoacylase/carboxypeptidase family protein
LCGTIRWFAEATGELLRCRIERIATHTATAMNCCAAVEFSQHMPPVINDPAATNYLRAVAASVLGPQAVRDDGPSMGAEDFCFFTQAIPGCIARLGMRPPGAATYPSLHNPRFDFNDDALPVGIALLCELALQSDTLPPCVAPRLRSRTPSS